MFIWFLFFFFHFSFVSFLFLFFFCSFFSFFLYLFISLSPVLYGLWSLGVIVKGQACTSKWKTQAQAIGAAENFQSHGILMCDSSPKGLYLNTKMRSHPKSSKLQCRCFMLNHSKIGTQIWNLADSLPKDITNPQTFQNTRLGDHCCLERQDPARPTKTEAPLNPTRKLTRHWSNSTHWGWTPQIRETTTLQPAERRFQTQ